MRSFLYTCLLSVMLLDSQAQTTQAPAAPAAATPTATARVNQAQGKYVFCYTQPVAPYDVAFSYQARLDPTESMTLNTVIASELTAALTESGAQLKPFDAILIQPGSRDLAIKFKDNVPQADRALATVQKVQGKPIYLFCEPLADYDVVKTEGISWYNHAFGGAYYTIGHVEENLLKTARKNERIQAIIFGETATYISFKK
jgi:hypothetical protein